MPSLYLRDLAATIQRQLPRWTAARVIPRGLALPIDLFLKGYARFMKKVGEAYPVLLPNLTADTALALSVMDYVLALQPNSLAYLDKDYLIDIGGQQLNRVAKVLPDGRVWLDYRMRKAAPVNTTVFVYGAPGYHNGAREVGADNVEIKLPTGMKVMVGDTLLQEGSIAFAFYEYKITEVIAQPVPPHTVTAVRITPTLQRSVDDGGLLYLKANPAYFSQLIPVPQGYPDLPVDFGPYLLDRITGLISDNPNTQGDVPETVEMELYQAGAVLHRTLRVTTVNAATPVQIWNAPILPEHMVLWHVHHGVIDLTPNALRATLDERGRWKLSTDLVPSLGSLNEELPQWRVVARSRSPFQFAFTVWPGVTTNVSSLPIGGLHQAVALLDTASIASSGDRPRVMELYVHGLAGQTVDVAPIMPTLPSIRSVRYRVLIETRGRYHWASSGLFLKPLFLSSEYVHAQGREIPLNQGRMLT